MYRSCELPLNYLNLNYIDLQRGKYHKNFPNLLKALAVSPPITKIEKMPFILKNKYVAAVVVVCVLVFAAWLISPLLIDQAEPTPTATPTISKTPTEFVTATKYPTTTPIIVVVTSTEAPVTPPTPTLTPTPQNTATASPSPEPKVDTMTAVLQATRLTGKAPLTVNFDARTSQAEFAEGGSVPCGNNPSCSYAFTIYRDSKVVERISNNTGLLPYTFNNKGQYSVNVNVCRGEACNDDGVTVTVK